MKHRFFKRILSLVLVCLVTLPVICASTLTVEAAGKKSKKATAATPNIVVVIDPGHDNTHHGCQYAGMDEGILDFLIAYYCVQELQRYEGISVYMTRTTTGCAYGANPNSSADCLAGRVNFAKTLNANMYVSIHNDFDPDNDPTANGCKVIYQNVNYNKDVAVRGYKLGAQVLSELTATGLNVNNWKLDPNGTGLCTRNSGSGKYPDGSARDYYAILNQSKMVGMPAIIVEHAFMSNDSDRQNHLSTPEQLQQLGVADATAIAKYYGLKRRAL